MSETPRLRPAKLRRLGVFLLLAVLLIAGYFGERQRKMDRLLASLPAPSLDSLEAPLAAQLERLRDSVMRHPLDDNAWGRLGMSLHIHQFHVSALACYNAATGLNPRNFVWAYFRAEVLQALDRSETEAALLRADSLRPHFAPLQWRLAQNALAEGRAEEGKTRLREALRLDPHGYPAWVGLAQAYVLQDSLPQADSTAHLAIAAFPRFREARALLADLHRRSGSVSAEDTAGFEWTQSFGDFPDPYEDTLVAVGITSFWHRKRAERHVHRQEWAAAAEEFRAVLETRPQADAFAMLGEALQRAGNSAEAERELRHGLAAFPNHPGLLNTMGFIFSERQDAEQAVPWYKMAVAAAPTDPASYRNLVIALDAADRTDEAHKFCAQGLHLFPDDAPLRKHCADVDDLGPDTKPGPLMLRHP